MSQDWMILLQKQNQLGKIIETNKTAQQYGLTLSEEDAQLILKECGNSLREQKRVEFGGGITPKIIYEFCDSEYIDQNDYADTIIRLQEIFYLYKNEMQDEITDEELLNFMKEQFDGVCCGDPDYLEGTCLDIFAQAIRAGYRGHLKTRGWGEFTERDIMPRWDRELYLEALEALE